ncbi:hypothetical protein SAMN05920897_106100 [Alkalispirochaeta americana]|uniref:G domain-containing protein n=1 Tax=Alkalispirochaeta americana TaxID=159291 RepID=A0A1N6RGB6_9SPIO|nr:ATP-binding protein [Alkalispirochaeta americana]SIQ27839.1 hypothetical protein SAMN05920897_106100 [Alkalispirochaeta americana]
MSLQDAPPAHFSADGDGPLLLVTGESRAGKSTLIRAIFGETPTGEERFCGDQAPSLEILETRTSGNVWPAPSPPARSDQTIHLAWYCLAGDAPGTTEDHIRKIRMIRTITPVAVVITRCDLKWFNDPSPGEYCSQAGRSLDRALRRAGLTTPVFETTADPDIPLDLTNLTKWSIGALARENHRQAFVESQHRALKRNLALAYAVWQERRRRKIIYVKFGPGARGRYGGRPFPGKYFPK